MYLFGVSGLVHVCMELEHICNETWCSLVQQTKTFTAVEPFRFVDEIVQPSDSVRLPFEVSEFSLCFCSSFSVSVFPFSSVVT